MKIKLLLILLFFAVGILRAQDTIRTLVISEARIDNAHHAYVELTNVGTTTLNLSEFEFGKVGPWTGRISSTDINKWFNIGVNDRFMLPNKQLAPGKSFVISRIDDWTQRMYIKDPVKYGSKNVNKPEMEKLADLAIHMKENNNVTYDPLDSVTPYYSTMVLWNGSYTWYVRHHRTPTDSIVVDQVNGVFDDTDGSTRDVKHDVAGFTEASNKAVLVRKFLVKKGNLDFDGARGSDISESEWLPIPFLAGDYEPGRAVFWTVGNHGDYHLSSLTSSTMQINWTDSILTVPWGVRNDDSIMYQFNRVPGIAWHYDYAKSHDDSAYVSVRTGDRLTVYACGNTLEKIIFKIVALPPTSSDNIVIPKKTPDSRGFYRGRGAYCTVTDKNSVIDTIMDFPYSTRCDTLLKYLEKAPNASWEFVFVDGIPRVDLKTGDKLKVTAENGSVKEYFIKPNKFLPQHNAYISAIQWPDIPPFYKGILGWQGDTIPDFSRTKYDYLLTVPFDAIGMPALVAKAQDLNAKIEVQRAARLVGTVADRTVSFTCTAQDDTSKLVYKVVLKKEKDPTKVQPWKGEPFISQFIFRQAYNNVFLEIVNPGTEPLDLSNYMITCGYYGTPAEAVTRLSNTTDWTGRYGKYIPGYKWQSEAEWQVQPSIAVPDLATNPIVQPGDVFVMAEINSPPTSTTDYPAHVINYIDIDFHHNPWGASVDAINSWLGAKYMLFKIINPDVKAGTKPANDPNDFELIDVWGGNGDWVVGGLAGDQVHSWSRKSHIYKGNPELGGSFGTTEQNSEWTMVNENRLGALGYGWPGTRLRVADGIGNHFMDDITVYVSTIASFKYLVSEGYSSSESIRGVVNSTTVADFYSNIIKLDTGQHLKVKKVADGTILANTDALSNGDTLIVVSQDSTNTTKYILEVTAQGLSNNAQLTSTKYSISISGSTGTITGWSYKTLLKNAIDSVIVPTGATVTVLDSKGGYVPLKALGFDTLYHDVTVNESMYLEVVAENGVDKIVYHFNPALTSSDAFVTSFMYTVDQENSLITLIPNGTTVAQFKTYVTACTGASFKLYDKLGLEREFGTVVRDDKLLVTAADGVTTKTYYFSMLGTKKPILAYVLSTVYKVNQVTYVISGNINPDVTVSSFLANLIPAPDATLKVIDSLGVENTGNIKKGDILRVTASDGVTFADYELTLNTAVRNISAANIDAYPNPTTEKVIITGIQDCQIKVYNILGSCIIDAVSNKDKMELSLSGKPNGTYIITIKKDDKVIDRRKLIKN